MLLETTKSAENGFVVLVEKPDEESLVIIYLLLGSVFLVLCLGILYALARRRSWRIKATA